MNPSTGTFTSMDTYQGSTFEPITLHKYLYANANPVMNCDPSGYFTLTNQQAAMAISGILLSVITINFSRFVDMLGFMIKGTSAAAEMTADIIAWMMTTFPTTSADTNSRIRDRIIDKSIPRVKVKDRVGDIVIPKTKKPPLLGRAIYRSGSSTYYNLTPRSSDINGLSFYLLPPVMGKYVITTIEAVNMTGVLIAVIDGANHVSIRPKDSGTMNSWISSKETANENPHSYSIILKSIVIDPFGRS